MYQNKKFSASEADAWFERNHSDYATAAKVEEAEDVNFLCQTLLPFRDSIHRVLEIGCSNGTKLEKICRQFDANGEGIDPSPLAVKSGNSRYKTVQINLQVGSGNKLPYETANFQLVYFAFCLYLFDREILLQSLAEADRVLSPGGFMVITDFDPGERYKRPYSHAGGVYSYKQDYSSPFTQSGLYYMIEKHSFSHNKVYFDTTPDERITTVVMYKEPNPYQILLK